MHPGASLIISYLRISKYSYFCYVEILIHTYAVTAWPEAIHLVNRGRKSGGGHAVVIAVPEVLHYSGGFIRAGIVRVGAVPPALLCV